MMSQLSAVDRHDSPEKLAGRVLVADDDPDARAALASVLTASGFVAPTAANSVEVLALVEQSAVDVVLADINMPGNERLELVRALTERDEALPVILITGHPSVETATQAVRLRVFDYLQKPVDNARLVALARDAVEFASRSQFFRRHRALLAAAAAETERCALLAQTAPLAAANDALGTYVRLAVQDALSTIADVGTLAEATLARDENAALRQRLQSIQPLLLLEALRETIHVLEGTKSSFRSRELAELRVKLERLLSQTRGARPAGA